MKPLTRIMHFVLEQAETQPLARRAQIYRDLASVCASGEQARELNAMADQLSRVDQTHQQLVLNFRRTIERS